MKKIVVLSGAGISAESGISTFRGSDGLWEGHDIMEVASPAGWRKNQDLVQEFYNLRRRQLKEVVPNRAHEAITALQNAFTVHVVTQNVDDLHERAGNKNVVHLHGELRKVRSVENENYVLDWKEDLTNADRDPDGAPLRPHIVWFGEAVPMMDVAIELVRACEILIIVGTSLQVYPAAGLVSEAPLSAEIYYIDPQPYMSHELRMRPFARIIELPATQGLPDLAKKLLKK